MNHREVMQQALEALAIGYTADAMHILRAALAEPQEPVAFAFRHSDGSWHDISETEHSAGMTALYTHPAPQRQPLPKHDQHCVDVPGYGLMATKLVRAVERAHGIGGQDE